ncbi:MAG: peptidoglycan editing factor PgeF [Acidimicrobiales bacterium]
MLRWPVFGGLALDAVVTTRRGGVSSGPYESLNLGLHVGDDPEQVLANRERAATAVGLALSDLVFCSQSHGRGVAVVDRSHRGRGSRSIEDAVAGVDALVTADPGVGLVVMVADCVPLVLYEPVAHVVACVHAGWRGTVARIVDAAIGAMGTLGARPELIRAGIGPAIPTERYQVGDEVADAVRACFGDAAGDLIRPDGAGRWRFDLWAANHRRLVEAGVPVGNIDPCRTGTGEGTPFFSHRAANPCGRVAAIAVLHQRGAS